MCRQCWLSETTLSAKSEIRGRTIGVLTGSRSAGAAGRIPLLDSAWARSAVWDCVAFRANGVSFSLGTFVDNLFSTGRDPESAVAVIEDAAHYLHREWELDIGDGSRMVLPAAGCDVSSFDITSWELMYDMRCLGQRLSNTSTIAADFAETSAKLWGSFYANARPSLLKSPLASRMRFLETCVKTVASFRWSRWPFQATYANRLNGIQNHMMARLLQITPDSGEDIDTYFSRRRRLSAQMSRRQGKWSVAWAKSCVTWEAHVLRGHDPGSWAKRIYEWHGQQWLQEQRLQQGRRGTGTRAGPGRPATRYHEGVAVARLCT